jgi:nucleotide-binding universal stress UspA family protein
MIAIRELLCATDIERPAHAALRYAIFMAERCHASLHVIHAWAHLEREPASEPGTRAQRSERALSEQGLHARLDAVVRAVSPTPGRATTHIVDGKLPAAVVDYAERHKSDLVLLGSTLGAEPYSASLGTLAQQVGHAALCPVLTVPHDTALPDLRVQRILLPIELEQSMVTTTEWAAHLARRFGAMVELLSAPLGANADADRLDGRRGAVEDTLRLAGVAFEHNAGASGKDLTSCILKRTERGACDLIVMAIGTRDLRQCSALANVRRASVVPVLAVRPAVAERRSAGRDFTPGASFSVGNSSAGAQH